MEHGIELLVDFGRAIRVSIGIKTDAEKLALASFAGSTLTTVGGAVSGVIPNMNRLVNNPVAPEESSLTNSLHWPLGSVPSPR